MNVCAFIGDEITATGFRLAGVQVYTPAAGETTGLFQKLMGTCGFIILSAAAARRLPPQLPRQCAQRCGPLVLQVPDAAHRSSPPDLGRQIRNRLGMHE